MSERPKVVITGMGMITPLGLNIQETWKNLIAGESGIGPITRFDTTEFPVHIAGEVKEFDPTHYMSSKEARRTARCSQMAVAAAQDALADAQLPTPDRKSVV
jgi:3-oxoacyl-[acyl-carrier-protein] synthase II